MSKDIEKPKKLFPMRLLSKDQSYMLQVTTKHYRVPWNITIAFLYIFINIKIFSQDGKWQVL